MTRRKKTKYVPEGQYVAEVEVKVMGEGVWSPYLSVGDAYWLNDVWEALRESNLAPAAN